METVTSAAAAVTNKATKLIWGDDKATETNESHQEPISGSQGKGTAADPFDKGNEEENPSLATSNTNTASTHNNTSNTTNINTNTSTAASPTPNTMSDATSAPPNPANAASGGAPRPEHETDKTGVVGNMSSDPKASDINPSSASDNPGAAPTSGATPSQKQQGADKPIDAPTGAQEGAVKDKKDEGEEAVKKRDPNDHSGEPLKMHGDVPKTQEERRTSDAGQEGGQEHGKKEEGTGEQWVKTSGMASDGGDFDATKPGAGREADRLMEQKGISKTEPGKPTPPPAEGSDKKDKVPIGDKIKAKLHIGSKDK